MTAALTEEHLRVEIDDGVAVLTLNRPDHGNSFSGPMGEQLTAAYRRCDSDDSVRAVVLTGAGRAFCTGADMGDGADTFASHEDESDFSAAGIAWPAWRVRKPVLAAMNGHAVGIGLSLAMQCDLRFVAAEAKYGFAHVRRGVMPDAYAHWTVPRIIGLARAADLFLTGRLFRGSEALELGIANRVLPSVEVLPAMMEVARDIAANTAPLSVAVTKRLLWESRGLTGGTDRT